MGRQQHQHPSRLTIITEEGHVLRTVFTALVSAIIGGFITALFVFVAVHSLEDESRDVTIKKSSSPGGVAVEVSDAGTSVREVYTRDRPGVVSVDVASSKRGPSGAPGSCWTSRAT